MSHNSFEKLNSGYNNEKNDIYFGCNQKFKHQSLESKSDNSTLSFKKDLIKNKNELSIFLNSNIINLNIKSKENESTRPQFNEIIMNDSINYIEKENIKVSIPQLQSISSIYDKNNSSNKKTEDKSIKNSLSVPLNYLNIIDMSYMFYECNSLISLTDISEWNTENVTNMSNMFCKCYSLFSLPDISKWNTENARNMSRMFYKCNSLLSLPNISKWNTSNVINMSYLVYDCFSLI